MTKEELLKKELADCFSEWEGDFDVDIEPEYIDEGTHYFSAVVTHKHRGPDYGYGIPAKVNGDECQIEFSEDCWEDISKSNVFCFMWFEEAKAR